MKTFFHIWLIPILIGFVSAIGLISALTGDDIWDVLSWVTMGIPIVVGGYYLNTNLNKRKATTVGKAGK